MFAVLIYIAAIVAANLSVAQFGPVVTPINAFLLIGLDLALRDVLHERWKHSGLWLKMFALIAVAGAISYSLNPASGKIALASLVAFCAAGLVDTLLYHMLRNKSYLQRSNGSNAGGAFVDSLIFPFIAFGGFMPHIVAMQFVAKVAGGALFAWIINRWVRK